MKSTFGILIFIVSFFTTLSAYSENNLQNRVNIWPTISFYRGADLCQYKDTFSQTRTEFVTRMARLATQLMYAGAYGREAVMMLQDFNRMYDQNIALATQNNYLDITLENTFKAFINGYYRDLHPRTQNISFSRNGDLLSAIRSQAPADKVNSNLFHNIDYFAYGTYSLAPNCRGDILVTLTLVGRNGEERTYLGQAEPSVVMSRIAAQVFEDFQRTKFPSALRVGNKVLNLIGGLNGYVDTAASPQLAKQSCETLDARLPNEIELDLINAYGSWSGGISLGEFVWALPSGKVFAPTLRNPSPVREVWEVNATEFKYYCVRD